MNGEQRRSRLNSGDVFSLLSSRPETNPTRTRKASDSNTENKSDWIKDQEKAFTSWINGHLKSSEHQTSITDIRNGLKDGLVLIQLMKTVAPEAIQFIRYHKSPRLRLLKLENVQIAFECMKREGLQLLNIEPADIVDGNLKLTLGLLQQLANHYPLPQSDSKRGFSTDAMLLWFQLFLPEATITNLTTSWSDGIALSLLLDRLSPGILGNVSQLDPANASRNIQSALQAANKYFQIPKVVSPNDIATGKQGPILQYLSYYCSPDSPCHGYLIDWVNRLIPEHSIINFTSDWFDGSVLTSLVNAYLPGTIDEGEEDEDEVKIPPIDRVQFLMKSAEDELGMKQLIAPKQFISKDTEEILRMGYLIQFLNHEATPGDKRRRSNKRLLDDKRATLQSLSSDEAVAVAPTSVSTLSSDFTESAQAEFTGSSPPEIPDSPPLGGDIGHDKFELQIHGSHTDSNDIHEELVIEEEIRKEEREGLETYLERESPQEHANNGEEEEERDTFDADIKQRAWIRDSDGARRLREQRKSQLDELLAEAELGFDQVLSEIDNISFSNRPSRGSIPRLTPSTSSLPQEEEKLELDFDFSSGDDENSSLGSQPLLDKKEREGGRSPLNQKEIKQETKNEETTSLTTGSGSQVKTTSDISVFDDDDELKWVEADKEGEAKEREDPKEGGGIDEPDIIEVVYVNDPREESEEKEIDQERLEDGPRSTTTTPEPPSECTTSSKTPSPDLSHSPTPQDDIIDSHNKPLPLSFPNYCIVEGSQLKSGGVVNEPIMFSVDCTKAGRGRLEIIIEDERGENLDADGSQIRSNVFEISFIPPSVGEYTVSILFGEKDVANSPFLCKVTDPNACIPSGHGLDPSSLLIGQEMMFQIDTSGGGPGSLQAMFTGSSQPQDFQLVSTKDGIFTYSYTLPSPSTYTLEVTWAGRHIKGSPFSITPPVPFCPEACTVVSYPNKSCTLGEEISISIDTGKAGYGELRAMLVSPKSEHSCSLSKTGSVYTVTAVPTSVGNHSLVLQYGGEEIPQSPVVVHTFDPKAVKIDGSSLHGQELPLNQVLSLPISTTGAGEGTLSVSIRTPNGTSDQGRIQRIESHRYTLFYTPKTEGAYSLEVFYNKVTCLSNPMEFNAARVWSIDDFTLIKAVPARGNAYQLNKNIEFNVHSPGTEDPSLLQISAVGKNDQSNRAHTGVEYDGMGKYTLMMRATRNDDYKVSITYKGTHLKGSPFTVSIHSPTRSSKVAMFDPVIPLHSSQPLELVFDVTQAGEGRLSASAVNSKGLTIPLYVEQVNDEMYRVSFIPRTSDTFMVTVLYADKHVNGSPFRVLYKEQVSSPPVCVQFEPDMNLRGLMGAAVYGRNIGRQEATVVQYERGKYQISFSPSRPDVFDLHVYWFDVEIAGSPFEIDLLGAENESSEALVDSIPYSSLDGKVGLLSATVSGKRTGAVPIKLSTSFEAISTSTKHGSSKKAEKGDESCYVDFVINSHDSYSVNLMWNGKPLEWMPVDIEL